MVEKAVSTVTIVLESRPTRSLVGKLPQRSSLAVREFRAASEERCEQGYGRVFAKLRHIVAHQNDRSYVRGRLQTILAQKRHCDIKYCPPPPQTSHKKVSSKPT